MKTKYQPYPRILLACAAAAAALLAVSCAGKPLPIGFVGPLTGPSSAVGLGARNGFLLAFGDGPGAAEGKIGKTRLIVEDDANDQDRCLEAFRRMKEAGCGLVVLGTTSHAAQKAIPWALEAGMLVISPTVSDPAFSGKDDLFFRVNESSDSYGTLLAKTIRGRYRIAKAGIIGDTRNGAYVSAVNKAFVETFAASGGETAFELGFDSTEGIPEAKLKESIEKSKVETLVAVAASAEAVKIAKYLEKERLGTRLFLPPWPLTLDLIRNGGLAVEGSVGISIADLEYRTDAGKTFLARYSEEYGERPSFTAMFGWEGAAILRRALAESGSGDPATVKARILRIGTFEGIQGSIAFNSMGDASRQEFLFEIRNGQFVKLE